MIKRTIPPVSEVWVILAGYDSATSSSSVSLEAELSEVPPELHLLAFTTHAIVREEALWKGRWLHCR